MGEQKNISDFLDDFGFEEGYERLNNNATVVIFPL